MAAGPNRVREPPRCASYGKVLGVLAPLWMVLAPLGLAVFVVRWSLIVARASWIYSSSLVKTLKTQITWPVKLCRRLLGGVKTATPAMQVTVSGPSEASARDNILFVHGWPDSGRLWDRQVAFMVEKNYR